MTIKQRVYSLQMLLFLIPKCQLLWHRDQPQIHQTNCIFILLACMWCTYLSALLTTTDLCRWIYEDLAGHCVCGWGSGPRG